MILRRALYWIAGVGLCLCLAMAAWVAFFTDLGVLLWFANNPEQPAMQWFSKKSIYAFRLSPEEVRDLNQDAGAYSAVRLRDRTEAEKMLKFFLSRGVEIDSLDGLARSTALHLAVSVNEPQEVALLLAYGARTDLKDEQGQTPLELARSLQQQDPEVDYSEVITLLGGPGKPP